ncbi:variable surface protein, partial [Plasmodium gonderi]
MALYIVDYIKLIQGNDDLHKTELHEFYTKFNRECSPDSDDTYCSIGFTFENTDPLVKKFYNKIFWNLKNLLNEDSKYFIINHSKTENKKRCIYFMYWFYDQVLKNKFREKDITTIVSHWNAQKNIFLDDPNNFPCSFYNINLKDIKDMKHLYDYLIFYDKYKDFSIINYKIFNSLHCNYIRRAINLYNNKVIECSAARKKSLYCEEFNEYLKKFINVRYLLPFSGRCKHDYLREKTLNTKGKLITTDPSLEKLFDMVKIPFFKDYYLIRDNSLNNIHLYNFYKMLDTEYDYYDNFRVCGILLKERSPVKEHIYKNCNKLKSILDNWSNILNSFKKHVSKEKCCEYLNYWLHDRISDIYYRTEIINLLYKSWNLINYEKTTSNDICWHKNLNVNEKTFKKKKKLYDFSEYYSHIKSRMQEVDKLSITKYCHYIKYHLSLYYAMQYEQYMSSKFSVYENELRTFNNMMKNEVSFLKEKCNGINLDFLFNNEDKWKDSLSLQEKESTVQRNNDVSYSTGRHNEKFKLKELPSEVEYKKLNNSKNIEMCYNECIDIFEFEMDYPGVSDFCYKFVRNLRELYKNNNHNFIEICDYFTHWVFDEITKKFVHNWNNISDIPFFYKLVEISLHINREFKNKHCNYIHDSNISFIELKKRKELHDYFKNYSSIFSYITETNDEERKTYCDYIYRLNEYYKNQIRECCEYFNGENNYKEYCSNYFKCDRKYDPHTLLLRLDCRSTETNTILENTFAGQEVETSGKLITDMPKYTHQLLNKPEVFNFRTTEKKQNIIIFDSFYISVLAILSLLGTLLICFLFYKFTPLGSFLNRSALKKKNI